MCELLGMECNTPTDIVFSFTGFACRGGRTGPHADGWGLAFYEGRAARVFLDPQPCAKSPLAEFVRTHPIKTELAIAHIRRRTRGPVALANTHPFMRELWGRYWIFAHNGHLPDFVPELDGQFTPVGETDSERAFCWLLQSLHRLFGRQQPPREALFDALHRLSLDLGARGVCNFLLSNGDCLIAHCSTRLSYIVRQAPFAVAHLCDQDLSIDFREVTTPDDRVAVVATVPLTDNERWETMPRGSLWLFHDGAPVRRKATVAGPETPPT